MADSEQSSRLESAHGQGPGWSCEGPSLPPAHIPLPQQEPLGLPSRLSVLLLITAGVDHVAQAWPIRAADSPSHRHWFRANKKQ